MSNRIKGRRWFRRDWFLMMFSGKDNRTIDMARVLIFELTQFYVAMTFYMIYKGNSIDFIAWATGAAAILAGGGAALGLKSATEPEGPDTTTQTTHVEITSSQSNGSSAPPDKDPNRPVSFS